MPFLFPGLSCSHKNILKASKVLSRMNTFPVNTWVVSYLIASVLSFHPGDAWQCLQEGAVPGTLLSEVPKTLSDH